MEQGQFTIKDLTYDVVADECPVWAADACALREEFSKLQKQYKDFGYRVLENGNLLVPKCYASGQDSDDICFRLDETRKKICGACHGDCIRKHRENPKEYPWNITKQVVMFAYELGGTNCPNGMSIDMCQLCNWLATEEENKHIGFKKLNEELLLIPHTYWNPQTNVFMNVSKQRAELCHACFKQNRVK